MFWSSVLGGLNVFLHWETYVVWLGFLIVRLMPFGMTILRKNDPEKGDKKFGLGILPNTFHAFAMICFITILLPIILGIGDDASWTMPWLLATISPILFLKILFMVVMALYFINFTPFLGKLEIVETLVTGGLILLTLLKFVYVGDNNDNAYSQISLYPGFLFIVGLVLVCALIQTGASVLTLALVYVVATIFRIKKHSAVMLVAPVGWMLQFAPVFIYGAWLGGQF